MEPNPVAMFLPLILISLLLAPLYGFVASRKGRSLAWALTAFVPLLNFYAMVYLLTLVDKKVVEDLAQIKEHLGLF